MESMHNFFNNEYSVFHKAVSTVDNFKTLLNKIAVFTS